jgi:signal transduction histidine kinase
VRHKAKSVYTNTLARFGELSRVGNSIKQLIMTVLVLLCGGITYYVHWRLGTDVVFTHLFYVPIIVAGYWWARKGVWISLFLAGLLLISHYLSGVNASFTADYIRAIMFVVVGVTIGRLREESLRKEQALELSHKQLEEEARLRLRFIDVLAHELRAPLTPIMVSASVLQDINKLDTVGIQKRLADNIFNGAQVMILRLEQLLDLARNAKGTFNLNLQTTDLNKFIKEVISRYQPSIGHRNQQLMLELAGDLPLAQIDQSRFEQVIINLLSNASKYSPAGSKIALSASKQDEGILIEVKDEGIGISPEDQAKLFQPYQRVGKEQHKVFGLGLGLSLVKQIVEAQGGKIWVTSQLEKGSTFSVFIPVDGGRLKNP